MMKTVTIGQIGKAHGLDGWVTVHPMTYDAKRFENLNYVYLDDEFFTKLKIESVESLNKSLRIKFADYNSREDAERLRAQELVIDEKDIMDLPKDVYFHHQLIACKVYKGNGEELGELVKVIESSSNDIYVVTKTNGDEALIPAISQFVKKVDIENKRIDIEEIPGLLD